MLSQKKPYRIIISGGGTGGHIYPAIAIANQIKRVQPEAEVLFVGAIGKMEMTKVPEAGYEIIGLPVAGLQRKFTLKNLSFPFKILSSIQIARKLIRDFQPDAVVGVGGYASAPVLFAATRMGIPALIQEQNSFAGLTNKFLSKRVEKICVAYEGMERFFPKHKVILTGNPVRKDIVNCEGKREEAISFFNLDPDKKTILVLGGSLGARTLNHSTAASLGEIAKHGYNLLWQTGKHYFAAAEEKVSDLRVENIKALEFIKRMDLAYAAADVVVSRSGALSVSELCVAGKPAIFVPSPNVAEDHQTKNAKSLIDRNAALLVLDTEASSKLYSEVFALIENEEKKKLLSENMLKLAKPDAAKQIVEELLELIG